MARADERNRPKIEKRKAEEAKKKSGFDPVKALLGGGAAYLSGGLLPVLSGGAAALAPTATNVLQAAAQGIKAGMTPEGEGTEAVVSGIGSTVAGELPRIQQAEKAAKAEKAGMKKTKQKIGEDVWELPDPADTLAREKFEWEKEKPPKQEALTFGRLSADASDVYTSAVDVAARTKSIQQALNVIRNASPDKVSSREKAILADRFLNTILQSIKSPKGTIDFSTLFPKED